MGLTRRGFLERVAAVAGTSMTYEAMTALGLIPMASSLVNAFELRGENRGTEVVVLGAGLAGMTVAYELGKLGYKCTVLEARQRPGGRCYSVRKGTRSEEDGPVQTARFDDGLYFNPGPMRIPHGHSVTLGYCRQFGLPIEVFVDENDNSFLYQKATDKRSLLKYRRREVRGDVTGYVSELLAKALSQHALDVPLSNEDRDQLVSSLRASGLLNERLDYRGSPRRGYTTPPGPGAAPGELSAPVSLHELLDSKTPLYLQPQALHDAPMFQIAGGTDRLAAAFASKVGDRIVYGAEVREIRQSPDRVSVGYVHNGHARQITASYGVSTLPLPVLGALPVADLDPAITSGLTSVQYTQASKIGLQFKRRFWEEDDRIFGGISRTDHDISQIVYPSAGYLGRKGLLIGYYQIGDLSKATAAMTPAERQRLALDQGGAIHPQYRDEFETAFSVSWQNVPWSRGGWAIWPPEARQTTYAAMIKGDRRFYFAGDAMTYLGGWMNGALESAQQVATALHARAAQNAPRA